MVTKMFELRQSNKLFAKILVAFFVVALALVMAFAPPVETVALANQVQETVQAINASVGVIVGYLVGNAVFSSACATAGITLTAAFGTAFVSALLAFLAAMGVSMLISSFIATLTSEKSQALLNADFLRAVSTSWDRAKQKVICSAAVFQMIVSKIRQSLGIESKDNNPGSSSTFKAVTSVPTMSDFDLPELDGTEARYHEIRDGGVVGDIKSLYDSNKIYFRTDSVYSRAGYCYYNDVFRVSTYNYNLPVLALTPCVNINAKKMYLPTICVTNGLYISPYIYYDLGVNKDTCYKDNVLYTGNNGDEVNIIQDGIGYHLYCIQSDGKIFKPESIANFIYLILYKHCNAVAVKISDDVLSGNDNVSDVSESDAAKVNTFDNGDLKNLGKTKSLDATYTEKNDRTKGIYDSIKSTGKSTEVKGEVTLDSVGISDATTIDAVGSLDVSDVIGVVGVGASDISVPDTATGDDIPVDVPTDNVIPFDVGPKLIKFSAEGISDKFPFCLPKFLKEQLNIMVADPKEPKFSIPFEVKSAKLKGDIDLDLTMGGKAKTITNITDFFLCAALLVGLVFATKKLEF